MEGGGSRVHASILCFTISCFCFADFGFCASDSDMLLRVWVAGYVTGEGGRACFNYLMAG